MKNRKTVFTPVARLAATDLLASLLALPLAAQARGSRRDTADKKASLGELPPESWT